MLCTGGFTTTIAGEIKSLQTDPYVPKRWVKRVDNVVKYIYIAGKQVWDPEP